MTDFEKALINRDQVTEEEVKQIRQDAKEEIHNILENGGSYDEIEELLMYDYGLEMDYIFDLI